MRIIVTKENIVYPFKLLLNTSDSDIPFSTEIDETSVTLPGVDGEVQVDNRYASKVHQLVLRSWPNISEVEKISLHNDINRFLVSARNQDQELYYERFRRTYYVRAVGMPEKPNEYATWIEFTLPLKAHDPYGYQDNGTQLGFSHRGLGVLTNRGLNETPAIVEFAGPCTNPSVTVNGTAYRYSGSIANGYVLRADARDYTVSIIRTSDSVYTNANFYWNDNFLMLPPGPSEVQKIENAEGKATIYWRNRWA